MILWILIFVALVVASVAGFLYLGSRIRKFKFIDKLAKGNKNKATLFSSLIIVGVSVVIYLLWGVMNAIVCLLHLIIFWGIIDFIFFLIRKLGKKTFRRYYVGLIAIIFTIGYLSTGWVLAHHVWKTNYVINTDKEVGNLKVALISDSHIGATFHSKGFAKHLREIQNQNPDVVLITGDFVDDGTTKEDMIQCCKALGKMKSKYGIYYVFGNHDKGYYSSENRGYSGDDLVAELESNGVTVLQDENVLIDDRFYIIGRQDRSEETDRNGSRASMKKLTKGLDSSKFSIVMDHQPGDYDNQEEAGVDLVLSGHTHGGQFFPFMTLHKLNKLGGNDCIYGYEKRKNTNFIVTSGISDWEIKFKTGCKSEYVIIDIKGAK